MVHFSFLACIASLVFHLYSAAKRWKPVAFCYFKNKHHDLQLWRTTAEHVTIIFFVLLLCRLYQQWTEVFGLWKSNRKCTQMTNFMWKNCWFFVFSYGISSWKKQNSAVKPTGFILNFFHFLWMFCAFAVEMLENIFFFNLLHIMSPIFQDFIYIFSCMCERKRNILGRMMSNKFR